MSGNGLVDVSSVVILRSIFIRSKIFIGPTSAIQDPDFSPSPSVGLVLILSHLPASLQHHTSFLGTDRIILCPIPDSPLAGIPFLTGGENGISMSTRHNLITECLNSGQTVVIVSDIFKSLAATEVLAYLISDEVSYEQARRVMRAIVPDINPNFGFDMVLVNLDPATHRQRRAERDREELRAQAPRAQAPQAEPRDTRFLNPPITVFIGQAPNESMDYTPTDVLDYLLSSENDDHDGDSPLLPTIPWTGTIESLRSRPRHDGFFRRQTSTLTEHFHSVEHLADDLLIPGAVGWVPPEGGVFDSVALRPDCDDDDD